MNEPYLIAHLVRGQPAFDIAEQIACPECEGLGPEYKTIAPCVECDSLGYWWIIPTSGHRAYPYHYWPWDELACDSRICESEFDPVPLKLGEAPDNWPDHYPHAESPSASPIPDLRSLGLARPKPKIERRI